MKNRINITILLLVLPLLMSVTTHFGYISGYTQEVFSAETFKSQYDNGIYKYRVFSKIMLLETDKILSKGRLNEMDNMLTRMVLFMDPDGNLSFYFSYFAINTFFFILSTIFFYLILKKFIFTDNEKKLFGATFVYILTVPIFQYVLVPYDYTSFFFNNLIIYLFLYNLKRKSNIISALMLLSIILATLNRETAALTVSFMAAYLYSESNKIIPVLKGIFLPAMAFMSTYIGLRFYFGFDSGLLNKFTLHLNLISPLNLFGLMTGIISIYMFYYFADNKSTKRALTYFLVFSLPYILVSLLGGITYEIRLWTPLIINLGIILLINENKIKK
jgi:hypothetical protein